MKDTVNISLIFDGKGDRTLPFISLFRSEINALLGSNYDIHLKGSNILYGEWSFAKIEDNYRKLTTDPEIDIIIGVGAITGSIISKKKKYPKPVIAIGIADPVVQGLPSVRNNSSGIHNLTYVLGSKSIIKDLEMFHKVYPFKKLGFIFYHELGRTITDGGREKINRFMADKKSRFTGIPIKTSIKEVYPYFEQVDAFYISYLGKFEGAEKKQLIDKLNQNKTPTFGSSVADTHAGILAAMAPDDIFTKIIRRISLNIEAILEGKNPSELPVFSDFEKNLTINMKTAALIDFSPKFAVLSQAEVINEHYYQTDRIVDLVDVMEEAVENNLNLKLSQTDVESAAEDISRARTDYYPSFSAEMSGVMIDEKRARKSSGTQSERTTTGSLQANQLIYSDEVLGNISSQKHLYDASGYDYENTKLDIIFQATDAYFRILKAKTSRKILKDNIDLIKKNLKTAEQREIIGYSDRSDVLRWQSQLATATTDLLAAGQEVIIAKNDLNRILNRKQDELFRVRDTSLKDDLFSIYSADTVASYIDNQKSLDIFAQFFIGQCIQNSVEIKALDQRIASINRSILSLKRKYYLPTINFSSNQDHVFTRDGEGADITGADPVDNPWSAGIYLDLPFYDGGSKKVDIRKNLVEISRLKKQKSILAQTIENNARNALSDTIVKLVNLESSRQAADFARQSLELVQDSYAKGTVSIVDLADAQNTALTGELNAISSIYEYLVSLFQLERVYGQFSLLVPLESKDSLTSRFNKYLETKGN